MGIFLCLLLFAVSKGACKLTPILRKIQFILKYGITRRKRDSLSSRTDFYAQPEYPNDVLYALSKEKTLASPELAKVGI